MAGKGGRRSTTWVKGQGGRKKSSPEIQEIQDLAKSYAPDCIKRLWEWAASKSATASPKACEVLLDRGFGKAPIAIHHSGRVETGNPIDVDSLTELQRRVLLDILLLPPPTVIDQEPE